MTTPMTREELLADQYNDLLKGLDAGASFRGYPEAFGGSWTALCAKAASAIRLLKEWQRGRLETGNLHLAEIIRIDAEIERPRSGVAQQPASWIDAAALQAAHEIVALSESWTYTRRKAAIQVIVAREMTKALVAPQPRLERESAIKAFRSAHDRLIPFYSGPERWAATEAGIDAILALLSPDTSAVASTQYATQDPRAWERRNIGPDGTPWSSWYITDDEPTPEDMKFDGYLSYEYRPLYAGTPVSSTDRGGK